MKIFLDLDGIIRDFVQGVIDKFNLNITHQDINEWNWFEKNMNMSASEFWEQLDYDFWVNLPKTPLADEVLELVNSFKPVILTSPTLNSAGSAQAWIRKNLPDYFDSKRYLIGPAKWACANEDSLLIDDSDRNINEFECAGGKAILFPAPWNQKREISFSMINLKTMLRYYLGDWNCL